MKSIDTKETREWVLNNRIANSISSKLSGYEDVEIIRLDDPTGKKDVTLTQRTDKANDEHKKKKVDILISIHHDAGIKGGSGGGITAYTQHISQSASVKYRNALYEKLIKHTGLKGNRANPKTTANFHITRESLMPAVLLELGYMDSRTDVPIIQSEKFVNDVGNAVVEFLVEEFKLVEKPRIINGIYRVGVIMETQVGAYNEITNATKMFDKLNELGFKSYLRKE